VDKFVSSILKFATFVPNMPAFDEICFKMKLLLKIFDVTTISDAISFADHKY